MGAEIVKKKLQLSYKKVILRPGKIADEAIQIAVRDQYMRLIDEAQKGQYHLFFHDPCHQLHNTIAGKCWQEKGIKGTIVLNSNTGRKRVTIVGTINAVTYKLSHQITTGTCDKELTISSLVALREEYSDGKQIKIILDNARYNRAYAVQDKAKELNIELIYNQPYCPNLNLIERVWKYLKKIFKNKYIEAFDTFLNEIISFCGNFDNYKEDIQSLLNGKMQIIKAA